MHLAQRALDAVVRRLYVDADALEYPSKLTAQRFGMYSQNSEDGILLAILEEAGVVHATFVELGCGHNGGNSGFLAYELGWTGVMIDRDPDAIAEIQLRFNRQRVRAVEAFITREEVDSLLRANGVGSEVDLLSIDIDGNDYWVWEAIEACSPRIVIVEYNALFGRSRAVVVPYDPGFERHAVDPSYFGASLPALSRLATHKGYRLVAVEPRGANAFFVRADVAPSIPPADPLAVFRPILRPEWEHDRPLSAKKSEVLHSGTEQLYRLVEERGLRLIDFTESC